MFGRLQWALVRTPKSGKGRQIRLTRSVVEALKSHRKRHLGERMRLARLCIMGLSSPHRSARPSGHAISTAPISACWDEPGCLQASAVKTCGTHALPCCCGRA